MPKRPSTSPTSPKAGLSRQSRGATPDMRINRSALIRGLAAAAARERERRRAAERAADEAAGQRLIEKLDEMAERLWAAPDWRRLTPEESRENVGHLNVWFAEHGYDVRLDERLNGALPPTPLSLRLASGLSRWGSRPMRHCSPIGARSASCCTHCA